MVRVTSPGIYPQQLGPFSPPLHSLVHSNGIFIRFATNNKAEYDVLIGLLADSLDHRILHLHVCLDSLLVFMQLNDIYHVHNPILFWKYLRVTILMHEFEFDLNKNQSVIYSYNYSKIIYSKNYLDSFDLNGDGDEHEHNLNCLRTAAIVSKNFFLKKEELDWQEQNNDAFNSTFNIVNLHEINNFLVLFNI